MEVRKIKNKREREREREGGREREKETTASYTYIGENTHRKEGRKGEERKQANPHEFAEERLRDTLPKTHVLWLPYSAKHS